ASAMSDTKEKLRNRAESYSTEASVYMEGDKRICVDIPSVKDANAVLKELGTPGSLVFKDETGKVVMDGNDIKDATVKQYRDDELSTGIQNIVELTLKEEGRQKFAEITAANIGKQISIVFDGTVVSSPRVDERIDSETCIIRGTFTREEAEKLATTIRIGAIPVELEEVRSDVVGAKLGEKAIQTSLIAGAIGLGIVILLMIILYRVPGIAASLALLCYVTMMIVVLAGFDITLTLPGIAGMILSIGMAVDANVIIFARIREEIGQGSAVRTAINNGFSKALSAIVDGNVTTLISAIILNILGSGTVRGFAQTLSVGIILSMISSLGITRLFLTGFYDLGVKGKGAYGETKKTTKLNIIGKRPIFFSISGVAIALSIGILIFNATQGDMMNYSIDFVGGTSSTIDLPKDYTLEEIQTQIAPKIAEAINENNMSNISSNKVVDSNQIIVRTKTLNLDERAAMTEMLHKDFEVAEDGIQMQNISAAIGNEMRRDALVSVAVATLCMLLYIWFRFRNLTFAAASVFTLLHDVFVVILAYLLFNWTVGTTFIACMLTIVGYSINATIVIFDRVRENLSLDTNKKLSLKEIFNLSINQTMTRSIYTSLTTLIMVVVLAIVGVSAIREFALPLIVGVVCGGFSS
ncbi:MAG: protein translocase subunit SecD, partial [Lachnospiraceae bacterium]|nr:protein translocase subunit SecD [Lachnospiraceae bacterium]